MLSEKINGLMPDDLTTVAGHALIKWIEDNKLKWIKVKNEMQSTEDTIFTCIDDENRKLHAMSNLGLYDNRPSTEVKDAEMDSHSENYEKTSSTATLMYSIAECFDNNPHLWPALRLLLEWAMTNQVIKSYTSSFATNICYIFNIIGH